MSDVKYVNFKPRWMRDRTDEDAILDETPTTGSLAEVPPRITARLIPRGGANVVSAKTLAETLEATQAIAQYAARDVFSGINPDFADLRSLSNEIVTLSRLTVEPFQEGSFVIAARLDSEAITSEARQRAVSAADVAARFDEILGAATTVESAAQVSIGALQTLGSLARILRREADVVEFASFDPLGEPRKPHLVDSAYLDRVQQVRLTRRPSQEQEEEHLDGTLTALDIVEQQLQVTLDQGRIRVKGTYSPLFQPVLVERFGRRVRLYGVVTRKRNIPTSIQVISVEAIGD